MADGQSLPPFADDGIAWHGRISLTFSRHRLARGVGGLNTSAINRRQDMDMRRFSGEHFIKVDDIRNGPLQMQIAVVREGKFDKADLVFETGDILSLNATNTKILVRAYGPNSDDWLGRIIELFLGEAPYQGKQIESVVVRPISPPLKPADQTKPTVIVPLGDDGRDVGDEIPY
jgi:hypothetical protein